MAPRVRRSEADYHAAAAARGGQWIGPFPPTTHHKSTWQCAEGHRWEAQLKNIEAGRWCPICAVKHRAGVNIPKAPADYHTAAERRGFAWLGPEVQSANSRTQWQCPQEHTWWASYNSIANVRSGCPVCAGVTPLTSAQFEEIARSQGIQWLGPLCSYRQKTQWRCPQGHTWWANYGNVRHGKGGCQECKQLNKQQFTPQKRRK